VFSEHTGHGSDALDSVWISEACFREALTTN
jgi:hypothetical protein